MGSSQNIEQQNHKSTITVTSINYSGILVSPFEFYSDDNEKQQSFLSEKFQYLLKKNIPDFHKQSFTWDIGKIDRKMQVQRYAPIYNAHTGLENQKLLTQIEFCKKWDIVFQKESKQILKKGQDYTEQQKKHMKTFDLFCYKAIVLYVYNSENFQQAIKQNVDGKKYAQFMAFTFSKSFIREDRKIQKTMKAIEERKVDVMFFQETTKHIVDRIKENHKEYQIVEPFNGKGSSIIFIRRSSFKKIYDSKKIMQLGYGEQFCKQLNWNQDTTFAFVDNLILISAHLTSKKDKNKLQKEKLFEYLQRLKWMNPNCHIIMGIDMNSQVTSIPKFLHCFPDENIKTVWKKRTFLQPQFNKANLENHEERDYLMTDLNIQKGKVINIQGVESDKIRHIPSDDHPYDHFVVTAFVDPNED